MPGRFHITLRKPDAAALRRFLQAQGRSALSYREIGASRSFESPPGYRPLRNRIRLGAGVQCFERAKAAVSSWRMFAFPWIKIFPEAGPITLDQEVVVAAKVLGVWCWNTCRIVDVIDTGDKFGFAYGTLSAHFERGEELFQVVREEKDDSVWYEIFSFSTPSHFILKLANPYILRMQKRFIRESMNAMQKAST